jgi:hypothetical protein
LYNKPTKTKEGEIMNYWNQEEYDNACEDDDDNEQVWRSRKEAQAEYDADFADCYENDKDDPNYPW